MRGVIFTALYTQNNGKSLTVLLHGLNIEYGMENTKKLLSQYFEMTTIRLIASIAHTLIFQFSTFNKS